MAFAIRQASIPLKSNILVDSSAFFQGSDGLVSQIPRLLNQTLDSKFDDKSICLVHSVPDQKIVWSSCYGQTTLVMDTRLAMDFSVVPTAEDGLAKAAEAKGNGSLDHGDMQLDDSSPYRIEIVWAKCQ